MQGGISKVVLRESDRMVFINGWLHPHENMDIKILGPSGEKLSIPFFDHDRTDVKNRYGDKYEDRAGFNAFFTLPDTIDSRESLQLVAYSGSKVLFEAPMRLQHSQAYEVMVEKHVYMRDDIQVFIGYAKQAQITWDCTFEQDGQELEVLQKLIFPRPDIQMFYHSPAEYMGYIFVVKTKSMADVIMNADWETGQRYKTRVRLPERNIVRLEHCSYLVNTGSFWNGDVCSRFKEFGAGEVFKVSAEQVVNFDKRLSIDQFKSWIEFKDILSNDEYCGEKVLVERFNPLPSTEARISKHEVLKNIGSLLGNKEVERLSFVDGVSIFSGGLSEVSNLFKNVKSVKVVVPEDGDPGSALLLIEMRSN